MVVLGTGEFVVRRYAAGTVYTALYANTLS